jgi:hypothetical protein
MTENDFDRTARLWLEDGPTNLSDRVLQGALDEIHVTRQRRALWPARRSPTMGMGIAFRLAAVAAVLVVAVSGFVYFSLGEGGPGGPQVSPTVPSPRGSIVEGDFVPLEPGTYITADPFLVRATFTVPAGWTGHLGGSNMAQLVGPGEILIVAFDDVYDPCHYEQGLLDPRPGPTVDDLVAAFTGMSDLMPGLDVTTPTDVTVGGYAGKQLTITLAGDYDGCTISPEGPALWELPEGGALYTMGAGTGDRVWILDVEGQRIVIIASATVWKTPQVQAEVQGIVDSIRLAPIDLTDSNS